MKKVIITGALILVLFSIIPGLFLFAYVRGKVETRQMKDEIFTYVIENQGKLASDNPEDYQEFLYAATGFSDAGVDYGYYYAPDDKYQFAGHPYGNGYLRSGKPNNGEDWYYYEQICENWFYYEAHFG